MNKIFSTRKSQNSVGLIVRTYAFKSDLKIKWVKPRKIPCFKPEKSGDLAPMTPIDKSQYLLEFRNSKELETANDYVKRLFTLEFNPQKYTNKTYVHNTTEKVKSHDFDNVSVEVKLAKWTGYIRAWQEVIEQFPRNKRLQVNLKELIDRRKKFLKVLRKEDYKKFEWLLEKLDVVYKPAPPEYRHISRKESMSKLTDKYCDGIKQERLDALKFQFQNEQPAFLEEKIRALEFIRDEQKACQAEVTITEEEIQEVKNQLKELKSRKVESEDY